MMGFFTTALASYLHLRFQQFAPFRVTDWLRLKLRILTLLVGIFLLSSNGYAAQVNLLNSASTSASGTGSTGVPSLTLNIPAGKNRTLFIWAGFERDHCSATDNCNADNTAGTGLGDNWPVMPYAATPQITARVVGSSGATINKKNALVIGGTPSGDLRFHTISTSPTGSPVGTAYFSLSSYHIALLESEIYQVLGGASSGTVNISLPDIFLPLNSGDEAYLIVSVYENVSQTDTGIVRNATVHAQATGTPSTLVGNYSLTPSSYDVGQIPNENEDGQIVMGLSSTHHGFSTPTNYTSFATQAINSSSGIFDLSTTLAPTFNIDEPSGSSAAGFFRNNNAAGALYTLPSAAPSTTPVYGGISQSFLLESDNDDTSDAPSSYGHPTHAISGIRLGASVDADAAILANSTATGDDSNGTDDEDGITMPATLTVNVASLIPVNIQSASGYLNAWFDWNLDGDFLDSGEQVATDQTVAIGITNLSITPPITAVTGTTFARFRVCTTTASCSTPTSTSTSGEVEDYQANVLGVSNKDYSDAPVSYGAPNHTIVSSSYLGGVPDSEIAQATPLDGTGDDATGTDDEDGVTFNNGTGGGSMVLASVSSATTNTLTITPSTTGFFSFWVDYDFNGTFDAAEQVFNDQAVTAGSQTLTFSVPTTAVPGLSYARARFSTLAGQANSATSAANDGEVEDYAIKIQKTGTPLSCSSSAATVYTSLDLRRFERVSSTVHWARNAGVLPDGKMVDVRFTADAAMGSWDSGETAPSGASTNIGLSSSTTRTVTIDVFQAGTLTPAVGNFILRMMDIDGDNQDISPANGVGDDAPHLPVTTYSNNDEDLHFYNIHDFELDANTRLYQGSGSNLPADLFIGSTGSDNSGMDTSLQGNQITVRVAWHNVSQMVHRYYSGQFGGYLINMEAKTNFTNTACGVDMSDSPASYGSVSHGVASNGMKLGGAIDADSATLSSAAADADGADDDGITLPTLTQGQTTTMIATVLGTGGYLQGWIDWNGDGDFADVGEQVATNLQDGGALDTNSASGTIAFNVNVPANAVTTTTFARFRWSTTQNLDSITASNDGEVEDYAVSITIASNACTTGAWSNWTGFANSASFTNAEGMTITRVSGSSLAGSVSGAGSVWQYVSGATLPVQNGLGFNIPHYPNTTTFDITWPTLQQPSLAVAAASNVFGNPDANASSVNFDFYDQDNQLIPGKFYSNYRPFAGQPLATHSGHSMIGATQFAMDSSTLAMQPSVLTGYVGISKVRVTFIPATNVTGTYDAVGLYIFAPCAASTSFYDYGDAPISGTASNGSNTNAYGEAKHTIVSGVYLGAATPDADANNQPSNGSSGDDGDGNDDEDGINLPTLNQGQTTTITATVAGAGGYLQGWIDFNGDGDFADTGEQVATNIQDNLGSDTNATAGTIAFNLTVPAGAITNQTYARFRWSTTLGLDATSSAINGEVEDYLVTINATRKISGTVFEDINYGGGAGRSQTTSAGSGVNGAKVELYDNAGTLVATTTTANDGSKDGVYNFTNLSAGNYYVRVVSESVNSTRIGSNGTELAVQTFRTDGTTAVTNEVGGRNPALADSVANTGTETLNTTTLKLSSGGHVQSLQAITLTTTDVTGIDFGFNFDTIVNTNDAGQGSLRQFILNSNLLGNENSLAQAGSRKRLDNTDEPLPAGYESSVFMIPSSALTSGIAKIQIASGASLLPSVVGSKTILDASTQTTNQGDTNTGFLGTGGTVGVDALTLAKIPAPEVELFPAAAGYNYGIHLNNTGVVMRGFAAYGFGNDVNSNGVIVVGSSGNSVSIEQNILGTTASSFTAPSLRGQGSTIQTGASGGFVRNNLIGFSGANGLRMNGNTWTVKANEVRGNGLGSADGLWGYFGSNMTIEGNLITDNASGGYDGLYRSSFTNNTVTYNGRDTASPEDYGVSVVGDGSLINRNIFTNNTGQGVLIYNNVHPTTLDNWISQNSMFANGKLGIDLVSAVGNTSGDNVSINDANDSDTGANRLINFPQIREAHLVGGMLTLRGCAPAGASIELFEADVSPTAGSGVSSGANVARALKS